MTVPAVQRTADTAGALLEARHLCVDSPGGRPLFRDLNITVTRGRVALIGRNGVGKSTLLEVLAGQVPPRRGQLVHRVEPVLIRQDLDEDAAMALARQLLARSLSDRGFADELARECAHAGLAPVAELAAERDAGSQDYSRGEMRKLHLIAARLARPDLLLLDEPTEDLDQAGLDWLERWLHDFPGGLLVVSHDRRLLSGFAHFFLVAESGCRYLPGSFAQLRQTLAEEHAERERQYVRNLSHLDRREQHNETVQRRRRRKKNLGRLHELGRCTPRSRLNQKRSYAQESQGRAARIRAERMTAVREFTRATRRALAVELPLELATPLLPDDDGRANVALIGASASVGARSLFTDLDMRVGRDRIALTGPNGAGKTTLIEIALGQRQPALGSVENRPERIGVVAQGATDWQSPESLLEHLAFEASVDSPEALARILVGHKFPLALADRPLASLSPGERVRAALICLFQRTPAVELLVLDEPTYSLDFVGVDALSAALRAWPGGLVVASHDRDFLAAIGIERELALDGQGVHRWRCTG